jgi:hypothetical protein
MKNLTRRLPFQTLAVTLTLTVTALMGLQSMAEAMLVPGEVIQAESKVQRAEDVATIQKALESKILKSKLHKLGLSEAEIESRLSKMSDQEIHQFASQIRSVQPAGDAVVYVLVVVVLVLLIIYLVKRV